MYIFFRMFIEKETKEMRPSQIKEALQTLVAINRPAMIWGSPGIGKSDTVRQVAEGLALPLRDVRLTLLDPVDLRGLPSISEGRTRWTPPDFLPADGAGILFLDELNAAPLAVQVASYQLVLDRRLGEYTLPSGWAIVAAGNRETDRAGAGHMPTALANRLTHLDFQHDLEDWCQWALAQGIRPEIVAFLRFRPELLSTFDPKARSRTFATPRGWHRLSEILDACPPGRIQEELAIGTVGEGAAAELAGFLRIWRTLPSPDAILLDPHSAAVPEDPATLYAIAGAMSRKASEGNFGQVVAYANRLPSEYSVLTIRDALNRTPTLQQTRPFVEWAAKNSDVLI